MFYSVSANWSKYSSYCGQLWLIYERCTKYSTKLGKYAFTDFFVHEVVHPQFIITTRGTNTCAIPLFPTVHNLQIWLGMLTPSIPKLEVLKIGASDRESMTTHEKLIGHDWHCLATERKIVFGSWLNHNTACIQKSYTWWMSSGYSCAHRNKILTIKRYFTSFL